MKFHEFDLSQTHYNDLPSHLVTLLEDFLLYGYNPGGFLTAVLNNDLKRSIAFGDLQSQKHLCNLVKFIANHFPARFLNSNSVEEYVGQTIRYHMTKSGYVEWHETDPVKAKYIQNPSSNIEGDINYV